MLLTIEHHTQYGYRAPALYTIQQLRLTPANSRTQRVRHWQLKVHGQLTPCQDAFGNQAHILVIDEPHESLLVTVHGEIDTGRWADDTHERLPPTVFLRQTPLTEADTAMRSFASRLQLATAGEMMWALRERMGYLQGVTQVDTPAAEAFHLGHGVCQDFTHAFIGCWRSLGRPARYVSGYLFAEDGSMMQTHAWVEVWHDDHWQGWDITHGTPTNETHVKLAVGLDYRSASPMTGASVGSGTEGMASLVSVHGPSLVPAAQQPIHLQSLQQQAQMAQQ